MLCWDLPVWLLSCLWEKYLLSCCKGTEQQSQHVSSYQQMLNIISYMHMHGNKLCFYYHE